MGAVTYKAFDRRRKTVVFMETENEKIKNLTCFWNLVSSILLSKNLGYKTIKFSALELNGSRIKRFRIPERSDIGKALRNWFKQQRSDSVPMRGFRSHHKFCSCRLLILI